MTFPASVMTMATDDITPAHYTLASLQRKLYSCAAALSEFEGTTVDLTYANAELLVALDKLDMFMALVDQQ